mmetsp:Transcript_52888/g.113366  ORF Transcript_52888/g.113366 Transcript_52888/m.113366 type:complete len:370 (-) Transcript_52888:272-1381(-)
MVEAGGGYNVTLWTMSGESTSLPAFQDTDVVQDLARRIRSTLGIPISVQQLAWGSVLLNEPSKQLDTIFQDTRTVAITLLRRPFTPAERAELHKRLVRATAAGDVASVRELLREGAKVNFDPEPTGHDASVALHHWEESPDAQAAFTKPGASSGAESAKEGTDDLELVSDDDEADEGSAEYELSAASSEDDEELADAGPVHPCGGLSPLLVALVAGHDEIASDFRQLGAEDVNLKPSATTDLTAAFACRDFPDIVKHIAQGADLNMRMVRNLAHVTWATNVCTPLHACVALHKMPGAYEVAQLLVKLGADMNAGDAEGDSPLAHTRYFGAHEMHDLYLSKGAKLVGPYYDRFAALAFDHDADGIPIENI